MVGPPKSPMSFVLCVHPPLILVELHVQWHLGRDWGCPGYLEGGKS